MEGACQCVIAAAGAPLMLISLTQRYHFKRIAVHNNGVIFGEWYL